MESRGAAVCLRVKSAMGEVCEKGLIGGVLEGNEEGDSRVGR